MRLSKGLLTAMFLLGMGIVLYPVLSNYYNSFHATKAIIEYSEAVSGLEEAELEEIRQSAEEYNSRLASAEFSSSFSEEQRELYMRELNTEGTGLMGYIQIPKIDVYLPIYHGTEESVLQTAAGHVEWSSLPVGGESSHCVISGHRGLPSAKLFTDLDKLEPGDPVYLCVLGESCCYCVDEISIILPQDIEGLKISENEDLLSLVTCTPYGINTHRLVVRAKRCASPEDITELAISPGAQRIRPTVTALFIMLPVLGALLAAVNLKDRIDRKRIKKELQKEY